MCLPLDFIVSYPTNYHTIPGSDLLLSSDNDEKSAVCHMWLENFYPVSALTFGVIKCTICLFYQ